MHVPPTANASTRARLMDTPARRAARSTRSSDLPSTSSIFNAQCDVEEPEWRISSHSAIRSLYAGVSRNARFLLSPCFSHSHVRPRRLFADYNTCSIGGGTTTTHKIVHPPSPILQKEEKIQDLYSTDIINLNP
jgi:hypothetical protein